MEKVKAYLKVIDEVIANGKYKDNWESLKQITLPKWYKNAKFGIFIHWGAYAVPAFGNEWYPRNMYIKDSAEFKHHIKTYGDHKDFGYKDFIPMFKAEKFDAAEWADTFEKAGAKFVMPVAEHHDGFQMYDSDLSEWCASKKGPKKDIVGLLKTELDKRDIALTTSSHRVEHYWFMNGLRTFDSGIKDPEYGDIYWPSVPHPSKTENFAQITDIEVSADYMEDWLARTCEIVDKYRPKIMYFDWWIQVEPMKPYLQKFAAYYYNRALEWGEEVTINYKFDAYMYQTGVQDIERGQLANVSPDFWQNDTSVAKNSWGYTEGNDYKKSFELICDLVDVVSKNGSLLLNIGPKADGTIPEEDKAILLEIGKWLETNGEAIYGTSYWKRYGEGPTQVIEGHFTDTLRKPFTSEDIRFTYKDGYLYAFVLKAPADGVIKIKALGSNAKLYCGLFEDVSVLGVEEKPTYYVCDEQMTIITKPIDTENPIGVKIKLG